MGIFIPTIYKNRLEADFLSGTSFLRYLASKITILAILAILGHFGAKWPNPGFGGGKVPKAFEWVKTGKKQELGIYILIGWKKVYEADF